MKSVINVFLGGKVLFVLLLLNLAITRCAYSADVKWSGEEDCFWNNTDNWLGKDPNRPLPTNDVMFFDGNFFSSRFTENEVIFNGAYANDHLFSARAIGTESNPLVFRATESTYGLRFAGAQDSLVGYSEGDAYLLLTNGTWHVGNRNFCIGTEKRGFLYLKDVESLTVGGRLFLCAGLLSVDGGVVVLQGSNYSYIGKNSFGGDAHLEIVKGEVRSSNTNAYITIGESSAGRMTVKKEGKFTCAQSQWAILLGRGAPGVLNVDGGCMTLDRLHFCYENGGAGSVANIRDGGIVELNCIAFSDATRAAGLNVDGGTLKARSNNDAFIPSYQALDFAVGANGAVIDANGHNITVSSPIKDMDGAAGAVTFAGGGVITLNAENSYTGGSTVEVGTKVVASTAQAKSALIDNGLVIDGRARVSAGNYEVLQCGSGNLTQDDLKKITLVNCMEGTTVGFNDNENPTMIVVSLLTPPFVPPKPDSIKAFPGKTLNDIQYGTFSARMSGAWISTHKFQALGSAKGYNKKITKDANGNVTAIVVELQILDDGMLKCVIVELTNGSDGVYASALNSKYVKDVLGYEFYTGTSWRGSDSVVATSPTKDGYGVCDLRVRVPSAVKWSLNNEANWSSLRKAYGEKLYSDTDVYIDVMTERATLVIDEDIDVSKIQFTCGYDGGSATVGVVRSNGADLKYGALQVGRNVTFVVEDGMYSPGSVALDSGSRLLYDCGEIVCAACSGLGVVEVAPDTTLYVDESVEAGSVLNNGTVVKRNQKDVLMPFNNASTGTTFVNAGVLKALRQEGVGAGVKIVVKSGATFDLNGVAYLGAAVHLEQGARFANTKDHVYWNTHQSVALTLDGDATITAVFNFGLVAQGGEATLLNLGPHTLTYDGDYNFVLNNTDIVGSGKIVVGNGSFVSVGNTRGNDCTLEIGADAEFFMYCNNTVDTDTLTVKNFVNNGIDVSHANAGALIVKGVLTAGNRIKKLQLENGSTVKVAGVDAPQVVASRFSASGTVNIDMSNIAVEQWRALESLPVLTVPIASDVNDVVWKVSNAFYRGSLIKWVVDEGGETRTLYVCKSPGFVIKVR